MCVLDECNTDCRRRLVAPPLHPFRYQGENDMQTDKGNSVANWGYSCLMQALVTQWRSLWSATPGTTDPNAAFGIVTLVRKVNLRKVTFVNLEGH